LVVLVQNQVNTGISYDLIIDLKICSKKVLVSFYGNTFLSHIKFRLCLMLNGGHKMSHNHTVIWNYRYFLPDPCWPCTLIYWVQFTGFPNITVTTVSYAEAEIHATDECIKSFYLACTFIGLSGSQRCIYAYHECYLQ